MSVMEPCVLARAHALLAARHPGARAFWFTDLDRVRARAERLVQDLKPIRPRIAFALKANGLPAVLRVVREAGLHADAGSLGELVVARACGFGADRLTLSGNGRTPEEAAWVAAHGIEAVSADQPAELDLLEAAAARVDGRLRVALRVNPGIVAGGHPHIETGHRGTKFGMTPAEALAVWEARTRWPHLVVDGVHVHVGSQLVDGEPLLAAAHVALELAARSAAAGAPLACVNLGGGFGVDYTGGEAAPDLRALADRIAALPGAAGVEWCFEPGRWVVADAGALVSEVLWDKRRGEEGERFVVLAAGMNDLVRPALYGARHRLLVIAPRPGALVPADVVGPVCESADRFLAAEPLPRFEPGDLVALLEAGAYGSVMSSNYNGRSRLAEVVQVNGDLLLARAPEAPGAHAHLDETTDRLGPVGG